MPSSCINRSSRRRSSRPLRRYVKTTPLVPTSFIFFGLVLVGSMSTSSTKETIRCSDPAEQRKISCSDEYLVFRWNASFGPARRPGMGILVSCFRLRSLGAMADSRTLDWAFIATERRWWSFRSTSKARAGLVGSVGVLKAVTALWHCSLNVDTNSLSWSVSAALHVDRVRFSSSSTKGAITAEYFFPINSIFCSSDSAELLKVRMASSSSIADFRTSSVCISCRATPHCSSQRTVMRQSSETRTLISPTSSFGSCASSTFSASRSEPDRAPFTRCSTTTG
mmetsp:Transcript_10116/g.37008  ORF Transcript_10116/g.37008 Transcript_10116/m.37008 type:complete len:281 (+) Transcript_10116:7187-8029(+)